MKKIYLIRHGQTEYNSKGIVQGRGINTSLNETGRTQALAFFEQYKDVPFKMIYVSSLQRTFQTVEPFIEKGIPYERLPGLDEISWGISEGLEYSAEQNTRYYKVITDWKNGKTHLKIEGGESPIDVQKRQQEAFEHILSKPEEDVILICMHGRAMRILLSWLSGCHLHEMDTFEHDNLSLYKLSYLNSAFSIDLYNDRSHLELRNLA